MKQISLSNGDSTLVDDEDFDFLNQHKWKRHRHNHVCRSATIDGVKTTVWMHREILKTPKGSLSDHINGNPLDNRRCNLRIANHAENSRNLRNYKNRTGFKGVTYVAPKRFRASITVNRKNISLGTFETAEKAYTAYVEAAKRFHKDFANIQCPRMNEVNLDVDKRESTLPNS